jgi:hypothetical protein
MPTNPVMRTGLLETAVMDAGPSAQHVVAEFTQRAMLVAFKHTLLSGRTEVSEKDIVLALKTVIHPGYEHYRAPETPTHVEGLEEFKQGLREEDTQWEQRRAGGSKSPPPPPPPTDRDIIQQKIAPAAAAQIMDYLMEDAQLVRDGDYTPEKFCFCDDAVQSKPGDLYMMWRADELFAEFVKDAGVIKTPVELAIIRSIHKLEADTADTADTAETAETADTVETAETADTAPLEDSDDAIL